MDPTGTDAGRGTVPRSNWPALARATGVIGLVSIVLLFAPIIALSTLGEPPLRADAAAALSFFSNTQVAWAPIAGATSSVGTIGLLWFAVGLSMILRRSEGDPPWLSTVALLSALIFIVYGVLDASWDAAIEQGPDLGLQLAGYAFAAGNLGFTNAWLAMASMAAATGWVALRFGALPRWIGWCALVSAPALVVGHYLWFLDGVWTIPYALFWVWVIATCIRFVRTAPTA